MLPTNLFGAGYLIFEQQRSIMFRSRISCSFACIFCLRIWCPAKENASSPVPHPSTSSRPGSSQPEPNDASSSIIHSRPLRSRISDTPTYTIIIRPEQDTTQSVSPISLEPILSDDVESQSYPDGLLHVESQPINTHHVFQAPPTHTDGSPSAAPKSICKHVVPAADLVMETGRLVPPEITITSPTPAPDCDSPTEHTPRSSFLFASPYDSYKVRHRSLFVPQPMREGSIRFSVPVRPTASRVMMKTGHVTESIRQSQRTSLLPIGPAAGTAWRDKRNLR